MALVWEDVTLQGCTVEASGEAGRVFRPELQ